MNTVSSDSAVLDRTASPDAAARSARRGFWALIATQSRAPSATTTSLTAGVEAEAQA